MKDDRFDLHKKPIEQSASDPVTQLGWTVYFVSLLVSATVWMASSHLWASVALTVSLYLMCLAQYLAAVITSNRCPLTILNR